MWDSLQKFDIGHLVKHLDTHHVADIIEKLILIDTSNLSGEETKFVMHNFKILDWKERVTVSNDQLHDEQIPQPWGI